MRRLIAALALAASPAPLLAQAVSTSPTIDPARITAARNLVDRMQIERTLDQMFVQLAPAFATSVIGGMMTSPEGKPAAEQLIRKGIGGRERLQAILSEEFLKSIRQQYPMLKDRTAQEYARMLTTDELTTINTFYATGAGAKFLQISPALQQTMATAGRELGAVAGTEAGRRGVERAFAEMLPTDTNKVTK